MPDLQQLAIKKEKIIEHIKSNGPSLPVHLAKALGVEPIFASAFLAELVNDQQLKTSNLRVGSSPLYHLSDQTDQLENFAQHLNRKEREAFQLLKSSQVLEDTNQEPAIRVALRSIKDFALPLRARIDSREVLFWRYFLTQEAEAKSLIQTGLSKQEPTPQKAPQQSQPAPQIQETPQPTPEPQPASQPAPEQPQKPAPTPEPTPPQTSQPQQPQFQETSTNPTPLASDNSPGGGQEPERERAIVPQITTHQAEITEPPQQPRKKKGPDPTFLNLVQAHFQTNNHTIEQTLDFKKKEAELLINTQTPLGPQTFYVHAKDKKTVSDTDLTIAFQKAQTLRMPALFAAPGKLTKKAQAHLEEWKHLIKFEQLKA